MVSLTARIVVFLGFYCCILNNAPGYALALDKIDAFVDTMKRIEHLRHQAEPDWEEIAGQADAVAPVIHEADQLFAVNYETELAHAAHQCRQGNQPNVHVQMLAKGLQHIAVLYIRQDLKNFTTTPHAAEQIAAFFEGIRPTYVRRDKGFFGNQQPLETMAVQAVDAMLSAGSDPALGFRRQLTDAIDRTYGLSLLYEIQCIEKLRDVNPAKCAEKEMEAKLFYRIIAPRLKKTAPKSDKLINEMISGSYSGMNAELIETHLNKGLSGITLR